MTALMLVRDQTPTETLVDISVPFRLPFPLVPFVMLGQLEEFVPFPPLVPFEPPDPLVPFPDAGGVGVEGQGMKPHAD
jgi:hypothetical protein